MGEDMYGDPSDRMERRQEYAKMQTHDISLYCLKSTEVNFVCSRISSYYLELAANSFNIPLFVVLKLFLQNQVKKCHFGSLENL